jgi:hypothetical protein
MGKFDFANIKEVRKEQGKIENSIFEILKENAPEDIKTLLPEECGQMEMGFNQEDKIFYFVMIDEEKSTEEEIKLQAISIDVNNNIKLIEDFEIKDE